MSVTLGGAGETVNFTAGNGAAGGAGGYGATLNSYLGQANGGAGGNGGTGGGNNNTFSIGANQDVINFVAGSGGAGGLGGAGGQAQFSGVTYMGATGASGTAGANGGYNNTFNITASNLAVTLNLSGGDTGLIASNNVVNANNDAITLSSNVALTINGNSNAIYANNDTLNIGNSADYLSEDSIYGNNNTISASGNTVYFVDYANNATTVGNNMTIALAESNTSITVKGNDCLLFDNTDNHSITIDGDDCYVGSYGGNNANIVINGNNNSVAFYSKTLSLTTQNNSTVEFTGAGDTINVVNGDNLFVNLVDSNRNVLGSVEYSWDSNGHETITQYSDANGAGNAVQFEGNTATQAAISALNLTFVLGSITSDSTGAITSMLAQGDTAANHITITTPNSGYIPIS